MKKFRLFLDYEKEENWLHAMAQKGWALKSVLFTYTFQKTAQEDTSIRVDFRLFKRKKDYLDYIALFEDSGWQHIAGYKSIGIHYFKKTREQANEDIFSDAASKAGRYKRASEMWLMFFICYIPVILSVYINTILIPVSVQQASPHHSLLIDLKSLYQHTGPLASLPVCTPGYDNDNSTYPLAIRIPNLRIVVPQSLQKAATSLMHSL